MLKAKAMCTFFRTTLTIKTSLEMPLDAHRLPPRYTPNTSSVLYLHQDARCRQRFSLFRASFKGSHWRVLSIARVVPEEKQLEVRPTAFCWVWLKKRALLGENPQRPLSAESKILLDVIHLSGGSGTRYEIVECYQMQLIVGGLARLLADFG